MLITKFVAGESAMNNGNPIEKMHANETSLGPDLKRRRLVRGAIGIAPVVLTLRSGVLAASSCTGAKTLEASTNGGGKLTSPVPVSTDPLNPDYCVSPFSQEGCPTGEQKISSGGSPVQVTGAGGNLFCTGVTNTSPVAILSSASVTSLFNLTN